MVADDYQDMMFVFRMVMMTSISLIRTVSIMVYMMMIWDDKHHDDDYENVTEVTQS